MDDKASEKLEALRESITCSITQEIFLEPVMLSCGHTFELTALKKALTIRNECPLCRNKVCSKNLNRDYALANAISAIIDIFPELAADQYLSNTYLLDLVKQGKSNLLLRMLQPRPQWLTAILNEKNNHNILTSAIEFGKTEVVDMLLNNFSFELNQMHQPNPLLLAMKAPAANAEIVQRLLAKGADPKIIAEDGGSALMMGLWFNYLDRVRVLLESELDLNINQQFLDSKNSALILAARKIDVSIFQAILNQPNIDVNLTNKNGKTAFYVAASQGEANKVQLLMQHPEIDLVVESHKGKTAFNVATENGHVDVVEILTSLPAQIMMLKNFLRKKQFDKAANSLSEIYHNFDTATFSKVIDEVITTCPDSCDHLAIIFYHLCLPSMVEKNDQDLLHLLLRLANKNLLNELVQGGALCHWAVRFRQFDLLENFVNHYQNKIDLNLLSGFKIQDHRVTPLTLAILQQDEQIVDYLLQKFVNPYIPQDNDALWFSIISQNKYIVKQICQYLSSYNAVSQNKQSVMQTVFHALQSDIEIFNEILSLARNDINYRYSQGRTLLHYAAAFDDIEKVKSILLTSKLNFYAKDDLGQDVLQYLSSCKRPPSKSNELLNVVNLSIRLLTKHPREPVLLDNLQHLTSEQLDFFVKVMAVQLPDNPEINILFGFIKRLLNLKEGSAIEADVLLDEKTFKAGIEILNRFFLVAHDSYYKNHHNWEKSIRYEAFSQFKQVMQKLPSEEQLNLLRWARTQPIFAYHRNFLSFGRTQTVIEIDKLIHKISDATPGLVPPKPGRKSCFSG